MCLRPRHVSCGRAGQAGFVKVGAHRRFPGSMRCDDRRDDWSVGGLMFLAADQWQVPAAGRIIAVVLLGIGGGGCNT